MLVTMRENRRLGIWEGEIRYGLQSCICVPDGNGDGVFRADLPDRADQRDERGAVRGGEAADGLRYPGSPAGGTAVSAAMAEDLGTDITGIRIVSVKPL